MLGKRSILAIALIATLASLAAGPQKDKNETTVTIKNSSFLPGDIKIRVGETVTWVNADDRDHTVSGDSLKSGNIKPGRTFSQSFTKAGTYNYGCSYHPRMRGTITVTE